VSVSPSITIGASGEHAGFPGTLSIGNEALTRVLIEIGRSADWCLGVIFVNGHGGNTRAVSLATSALLAESRRVAAWAPRMDGDAHAGEIETSMMLAIAPDRVNMAAAESGNMQPLSEIMNEIQLGGVISVSTTGVLGDPRAASRDTGEQLVAGLVAELAAFVELRRKEWT
jgi:creatinine amidohydrolase